MIFIISGVCEVCLEFERSVELMVHVSFQLGSLLQVTERLKYKLFLVLRKCLTALIPLSLQHSISFLAITILAVQLAPRYLDTLRLEVTLASITKI